MLAPMMLPIAIIMQENSPNFCRVLPLIEYSPPFCCWFDMAVSPVEHGVLRFNIPLDCGPDCHLADRKAKYLCVLHLINGDRHSIFIILHNFIRKGQNSQGMPGKMEGSRRKSENISPSAGEF